MEINRDNWRDYAACLGADPEAWFPESGGFDRDKAVKICLRCDARIFCLLDALGQKESIPGIWGATGELDRRKMRMAGRHTWPKLDQDAAA
jgi:Transcription factor WhiB